VGGNRLELTLELTVDPATSEERRALLLADLQRYADVHWGTAQATVRPSRHGATLDLAFAELSRRLEEMQDGAHAAAHRRSTESTAVEAAD
jgi:hypothetical protein